MEENSRSEEEEENPIAAMPSSSRALRNQAEKQRRDKMNHFINELAQVVPMVKSSSKKLDKTSILRLSATFLRAQCLSIILFGNIGKQMAAKGILESLHRMYEDMNGILLAVTASGKIVYITENVENFLGHHMNDLLGSSLFEITHPEDQEKLEYQMKPEDQNNLDEEGVAYGDRRHFTLRVKLRAASKSDQPQYMCLKVDGRIRIAVPESSRTATKCSAYERFYRPNSQVHEKAENGLNKNDIVLLALLREFKIKSVPSNAILESAKEEWLSRHLLNGTIVFSDHRISHLCGYMSHEVFGEFAFKFIHKDDVRWVMIALRQMFNNSESYGWSAYRLQQKNGEYIYLRTEGYLELEEGTPNAKSFICVNMHVGEKEGKKLINEMKKKFSPIVANQDLPLASLVNNQVEMASSSNLAEDQLVDPIDLEPLETSEPQELNSAVELMFSKFNQVVVHPPPPEKRDMNFSKLELVSKYLPPIQVPIPKAVSESPSHEEKYNRPSVITSVPGSGERPKRPPEIIELTHKTEIKRLRSESRSVIMSDKRSVIKRNEPDSYDFDEDMINPDLLFLSGNSNFSQISDDESIRFPDGVNSSEPWDASPSDLEDGVRRSHIHLKNSLQSQGVQIDELEEDLDTIPIGDSSLFRNHITTLKAEHRKQQEILKTLQHDHQIIQKI